MSNNIQFKILEATRSDQADLCPTCMFSRIMKGAGESDEVRFCNFSVSTKLHSRIASCNNYFDKTKPSLNAMEDIAWILRTKKVGKTIGFVSPEDIREERNQRGPSQWQK